MGAPIDTIIQGDALTVLKTLDANSVDMCVTSPPYWGLRDYKTDGQLGLEPTFHQYLEHLIEIFAEVKRVIKKTGSIWVNIGDSYNDNKSLSGIPERFAIRMTDELGLIRRNTIIWHKPNCMPSSARDRFTVDFEYIYFFSKSPRYHFETQYEPLIEPNRKRGTAGDVYGGSRKHEGYGNPVYSGNVIKSYNPLGRQKRSVWRVSTKPFSGAHFAVFPPTLIEPMIKSGCPEQICNKCGKARKLVYEVIGTAKQKWGKGIKMEEIVGEGSSLLTGKVNQYKITGLSGCGCDTGFHAGVVLDPFMGAGTTAITARALNRHFLGIDLNPDYVAMSKARLGVPITDWTAPSG